MSLNDEAFGWKNRNEEKVRAELDRIGLEKFRREYQGDFEPVRPAAPDSAPCESCGKPQHREFSFYGQRIILCVEAPPEYLILAEMWRCGCCRCAAGAKKAVNLPADGSR